MRAEAERRGPVVGLQSHERAGVKAVTLAMIAVK